MLKRLIMIIAHSKYSHIFLGLIVVAAGLGEVMETIAEDFSSGNIHSGHGVVILGVWHVLKALGELIEGSDYLDEGLE